MREDGPVNNVVNRLATLVKAYLASLWTSVATNPQSTLTFVFLYVLALIWISDFTKRYPNFIPQVKLGRIWKVADWIWEFVYFAMIGMFVPILLFELYLILLNHFRSLKDNDWWPTPIMISMIFCAGVGLFMLREKERPLYGMIELFAALAAATHFVSKLPIHPGDEELIKLITCLYLVVRGLDNFTDGRTFRTDLQKKRTENYARKARLGSSNLNASSAYLRKFRRYPRAAYLRSLRR